MPRVILPAMGALALTLALMPLLAPRPAAEEYPPVLYSDVTLLVGGEPLYMALAHIGPLPEELKEPASPFVLSGFARQAIPSRFAYNASGAPAGNWEQAVVGGYTGWNAITVSFAYSYAGPSSETAAETLCARAAPNGTSSLVWTPIQWEGVLGAACWTGADECDVIIDPDWPWGPGLDLQTVILHESGHCAGLGHSAAGPSLAVMAPTYAGEARAPKPDDVAAICQLYGCLGPSPTPAPTPTQAPTAPLPKRAVLPALARE